MRRNAIQDEPQAKPSPAASEPLRYVVRTDGDLNKRDITTCQILNGRGADENSITILVS